MAGEVGGTHQEGKPVSWTRLSVLVSAGGCYFFFAAFLAFFLAAMKITPDQFLVFGNTVID
jgi:hypothetical protein